MLYASNDFLVNEVVDNEFFKITNDGVIMAYTSTRGGYFGYKYPLRDLRRLSSTGYYRIQYKYKCLQVHRIIYRKYIGELSPYLTINHKDGNKLNNDISNLELVTVSENNAHRYKSNPPVKGNAKINFNIAQKIRNDRTLGYSYLELVSKYKMSKSTISYIVNNKIWVDPFAGL